MLYDVLCTVLRLMEFVYAPAAHVAVQSGSPLLLILGVPPPEKCKPQQLIRASPRKWIVARVK